ncbi:hypothetical protein MTBPR1_30195 [Candidatus Terasakiella magnetica]|uniref:Response regulatory domain-containing protein n=1 Tax=Candidatus Terasakiella magnetica TaxID=1867952 RepID=A0A1C3RHT4_9PROT|nr:response regulator [Candidatus Terasakiella magnetica]SCA56825.1 hypothetical protein MTBPR1_30195 [Candidatus Terasakiella magnetica]
MMINVLIVDDDQMILDSTKVFLEANDYQVTIAHDGIEAVELMEKQSFDIAVVDLFMPRSGGIETIAKINNRMPVIAVSGVMKDRLSEKELSHSLQVDQFLPKPFEPHRLITVIDQLLN